MIFFHTFSMALYHKWDVKTGFIFALQFFMLISHGLGGVFYHNEWNEKFGKLRAIAKYKIVPLTLPNVCTTFVNVSLDDLGMKKIENGLTEHMGIVEMCPQLILADKCTLFHSGGR